MDLWRDFVKFLYQFIQDYNEITVRIPTILKGILIGLFNLLDEIHVRQLVKIDLIRILKKINSNQIGTLRWSFNNNKILTGNRRNRRSFSSGSKNCEHLGNILIGNICGIPVQILARLHFGPAVF